MTEPIVPRLATPDDTDEIVRLAGVMYRALGAAPPAIEERRWQSWCEEARRALHQRLGEGLVVFVCDRPVDAKAPAAAPGSATGPAPGPVTVTGAGEARTAAAAAPRALVACGAGSVATRLPNPWHGDGRVGYVQWMSTDEAFQRQGLGRAVLRALVGWFAAAGIDTVELHASSAGVALYRSEGFWEGSTGVAMRRRSWDLPPECSTVT